MEAEGRAWKRRVELGGGKSIYSECGELTRNAECRALRPRVEPAGRCAELEAQSKAPRRRVEFERRRVELAGQCIKLGEVVYRARDATVELLGGDPSAGRYVDLAMHRVDWEADWRARK